MPGNSTVFRVVTDRELEGVLLVCVKFSSESYHDFEREETVRLVESAGGQVAGILSQNRSAPDRAYFIGRGKAEEAACRASALEVTTIVVDHDLSPGQVNRLEKLTDCKVVDRTELILAIFAVQARTPQARIRIELAQLRYMLPRLSGMWHHLGRLGAGIGTRGPGETQLEVDRRRARARISSLEKKIASMETSARVRRLKRNSVFSVALAGYTNAGKSTLLNTLCDAGVRSEDKLFATLDTTSRRLILQCGEPVIISDTVGFIDKLPESLLESFRSTLDVVLEADLVLLVADASDPEREAKVTVVRNTLKRIGAENVPHIVVWNKKDLALDDAPYGMSVSALTGDSLDRLAAAIQNELMKALDWRELRLDICTGETEYWLRSRCIIERFERTDSGGAELFCGFRRSAGEAVKYLNSKGIIHAMSGPIKETDVCR
ncbi:GTPase HflX [Candidatus Fermentibacteria bacterium]|nr:MAG: GTPase HflX [Candidatus Fermentibacteria bacterium]